MRHLGRTLRNVELVTIEPRPAPYDPSHALYHAEHIEECFGGSSVSDVLDRLRAGGTAWHEQSLEVLEGSSPLGLELTMELLRAARHADCWTDSLRIEAKVSAAARGAPDCLTLALPLPLTLALTLILTLT